MKKFFEKFVLAVCAVSASVMLLAAPVMASSEGFRSGPGESAEIVDTTTTSSGDSAEAAAADDNTVDNIAASSVTSQTTTTNRKYLTKWGGFFWFLLSIIVNFILSCWIGNRFYRMARRSAQGSNEIRALRKDIEEKFSSTLKDIEEPAVEVVNRNENYARNEESISMPERRSQIELSEDEVEMMRRWDADRVAARESSERRDEPDDDFEDEPEPRRGAQRSYQPTRRLSGIEFDDEEYAEDEQYISERREKRRPARRGGNAGEAISNAKNKAKDFLSNVFPFDE